MNNNYRGSNVSNEAYGPHTSNPTHCTSPHESYSSPTSDLSPIICMVSDNVLNNNKNKLKINYNYNNYRWIKWTK